MESVNIGITLEIKKEIEMVTFVDKLKQMSFDSTYTVFEVNKKKSIENNMIRWEGKDGTVIVFHGHDKDTEYHLGAKIKSNDEAIRNEVNAIFNKVMDYFTIIPTVAMKSLSAQGEFRLNKLGAHLIRIVDPRLLLALSERTGIRLVPRGVSFTSEFNGWSILFITADEEATQEAQTTNHAVILNREDVREERDLINNAYKTATSFVNNIKTIGEINVK